MADKRAISGVAGSFGDPEPGSCRERGQTLVVAAVVLVGLVAFLALIVDLGNVYTQRRVMQNAADAAAMAGARDLALSKHPHVDSFVQEYAVNRNGAQAYSWQALSRTVFVSVSKNCGTFFAPVIGVPSMRVGATAEAGWSPASAMPGLVPILLDYHAVEPYLAKTYTNGTGPTIQIWDSRTVASGPGRIAKEQRGWANFNGGEVSEHELSNWILNGYPEEISIGDWTNGTPGTKQFAMQSVGEVLDPVEGTILYVPLYDQLVTSTLGNGVYDYHICAFAAFLVKSVVDTGSPKYMQGNFVQAVATVPGGGEYDTGLRVVNLLR